MAITHRIRTLARRLEGVRDGAAFLAPLATRVTVGLGFHRTGLGKLENLDRTTAFFTELGIPAPALHAALVGGLETVGGLMLLAGLLTRSVAALLSATMLVALGTAEREGFVAAWGTTAERSPTDIAAWVFLLLTGWLLFHGPGALSLDALLRRFVFWRDDAPIAALASAGR